MQRVGTMRCTLSSDINCVRSEILTYLWRILEISNKAWVIYEPITKRCERSYYSLKLLPLVEDTSTSWHAWHKWLHHIKAVTVHREEDARPRVDHRTQSNACLMITYYMRLLTPTQRQRPTLNIVNTLHCLKPSDNAPEMLPKAM